MQGQEAPLIPLAPCESRRTCIGDAVFVYIVHGTMGRTDLGRFFNFQVLRLLKAMMAYRAEDRPLPEELLEDPWFGTPVDTPQQVNPAQAQAALAMELGGDARGPPYSGAGTIVAGICSADAHHAPFSVLLNKALELWSLHREAIFRSSFCIPTIFGMGLWLD